MADLTIHELQNEATTPAANDYMVMDGATAGTRKITPANLAAWIHNKWAAFVNACTAIMSFASGDFIAVSNPTDGTRKMSKDTLLQLTSQNALAGNVATEFVPNSTTTVAGQLYVYGGSLYLAKESYNGPWNASKFTNVSISYLLNDLPSKLCSHELLTRLVGNRLDDSQFVYGVEIGSNGAVVSRANRGHSGFCPCLPGETLYFWRENETYPNRFANNVAFYDKDKNFISSPYSEDNPRAQVVPSNAFYFSVPINYVDGVPKKTVVSNYIPNGFMPYATSAEKNSKVAASAYCPVNVFDPEATTDGSYISNVSNGEEVWTVNAEYSESDYIKVTSRMLFCYYDVAGYTPDKWPIVNVTEYDVNKGVLRKYVSVDAPSALLLAADVAYVRLSLKTANKYKISYGFEPFKSFVPYGYALKAVLTKDIADESGNSSDKPISQRAATELFFDAGAEPTEFELDLTGMQTDILSTARNYILKEYEENGTRYFEFSNDCGATFVKTENTVGQINFVHFFSTGRVLICGSTKCYYTDDFETFTETTVYDLDGSAFVPESHHFFRLGNYNSEYNELDGREVLVWNDYNVESGYKSRVWFTDDYGVTLKCILKANESLDSDGNLISVRHFHRVFLENDRGMLWVTSGDAGDECKLLCGKIVNDEWSFDLINKGPLYKLSQINIRRPYAYFVTDYTGHELSTGLVVCPVEGLDNPQNFRYLYRTADNQAMSKYFEDELGHRVLVPDGSGYHKMYFANGNFDFKEVQIVGASNNIILNNMYGPNYLGQVIVLTFDNGYTVAENPSMNLYARYNFSAAMKKSGFRKFGKIMKLVY